MTTKVLIVDDNKDIIMSIKVALEDMDPNYEFYEASDYETCMKELNDNEIDVILMDIMLANDVSGIDIAKKIKQNPQFRSIKILFLTAKSDEETKNNSFFIGEDFIEKPFKEDKLHQAIKKALSKKSPVYLKDELKKEFINNKDK